MGPSPGSLWLLVPWIICMMLHDCWYCAFFQDVAWQYWYCMMVHGDWCSDSFAWSCMPCTVSLQGVSWLLVLRLLCKIFHILSIVLSLHDVSRLLLSWFPLQDVRHFFFFFFQEFHDCRHWGFFARYFRRLHNLPFLVAQINWNSVDDYFFFFLKSFWSVN